MVVLKACYFVCIDGSQCIYLMVCKQHNTCKTCEDGAAVYHSVAEECRDPGAPPSISSEDPNRREVKPTRREPRVASPTGGMRDNCQDRSPCATDSVDMFSSTVAVVLDALATVPEDISPLISSTFTESILSTGQ